MTTDRIRAGVVVRLLVALIGAWASVGVAAADRTPTRGPLVVHSSNPRYFADRTGKTVYLTGFHDGWELQDYAWGDKDDWRFDWSGFLDDLVEHNCNVIRLWVVEHTKLVASDASLTDPMPYERAADGPKANDGGFRFDLDRFNEDYFKRLRSRVADARKRGVYVIVMLFQGWSVEDKGGRVGPWPYHAFNAANNVNGVDGDLNGDGQGTELHTWQGSDHEITKRQRAYVRKVIDTVNDLDNVLYEIANESGPYSTEWQYQMIRYIKEYEKTKPMQHPVGMTSQNQGRQAWLVDSPADWISAGSDRSLRNRYRNSPPPAEGRKVSLLDTDHIFGDKCKDHTWVWKSFLRGHNPIYMDRWSRERKDPDRELVRRALGQTRTFADRLDLAAARVDSELASTGYCLAAPGKEYVVYVPSGGKVKLDLRKAEGEFSVEWFDPKTGKSQSGKAIRGGVRRTLKSAFSGDAVLCVRSIPRH